MTFYKIVDNIPQVGGGSRAPKGFIEYDPENPPQELKHALANQKELEEKENSIAEAKNYLKETDWIITKINEYKILERDVSDLLKKYSTELKKREKARNLIST